MEQITIKSPQTLGCTVASTSLLLSLRRRFPKTRIIMFTRFPDLFENFEEVDEIIDLNTNDYFRLYDINLENYLNTRGPQTSLPYRHLIEHMFEIAEEKMGKGILERGFGPKVNLTQGEIGWAHKEVELLSQGKPLVWLQTKSRVPEKDVPTSLWREVIEKGNSKYSFIDLSSQKYNRRQAIALTKAAAGGITLDSFLLHGSHAVSARNVIILLTSSHSEVVCYPDQILPTSLTAGAILDELGRYL